MKNRIISFSVLLSIVLFGCSDDDFPTTPGTIAPRFSWTATATELVAPLEVTFTNETIVPADYTGEVEYLWSFGDGETSDAAGATVTHTFTEPGSFTVRLTAISERNIDSFAQTISISDPSSTGVRVYFSDASVGVQLALANDNAPIPSFFSSTGAGPNGIVVDTVNNHVYLGAASEGIIYRVGLDGEDETPFLEGLANIDGLALDYEGFIYWTNGDGVQRAAIDGTGEAETIVTGQQDVRGVAIDGQNRKLYWTNYIEGIWMSELDGSNASEIISPAVFAGGAAITVANDKLFFYDFNNGTSGSAAGYAVKMSDLDGSNIVTIQDTGIDGDIYGMGYDPVEEKVYWTGSRVPIIYRINADGSGGVETWLDGTGLENEFYGLAIGPVLE